MGIPQGTRPAPAAGLHRLHAAYVFNLASRWRGSLRHVDLVALYFRGAAAGEGNRNRLSPNLCLRFAFEESLHCRFAIGFAGNTPTRRAVFESSCREVED